MNITDYHRTDLNWKIEQAERQPTQGYRGARIVEHVPDESGPGYRITEHRQAETQPENAESAFRTQRAVHAHVESIACTAALPINQLETSLSLPHGWLFVEIP